jgi:hypothetical protein
MECYTLLAVRKYTSYSRIAVILLTHTKAVSWIVSPGAQPYDGALRHLDPGLIASNIALKPDLSFGKVSALTVFFRIAQNYRCTAQVVVRGAGRHVKTYYMISLYIRLR